MSALTIAQIVISIVVILLVLLQDHSSGAGSLFGGGNGEAFYQKRRGMEGILFILTVVFIVLFVAVSIIKLAL
jgi:protein translocase SecG subunit